MRMFFPLFIFLFTMTLIAFAEQYPTQNVFYRVFKIKKLNTGRDAPDGTAFAVEVDKKQYLITAQHVLGTYDKEVEFELYNPMKKIWIKFKTPAIYPSSKLVDIVALELDKPITDSDEIEPTSNGLTVGQQVFFLGYPYGVFQSIGMKSKDQIEEVAFVKSGVLSAIQAIYPEGETEKITILFIDAINNPGFSGGPVIFKNAGAKNFNVAAVVKGFQNDIQPIIKKKDLKNFAAPAYDDLYTRANSGIMLTFSIDHIIDAIRSREKK
jgi:S1-C subfamily serine protease